MIASGAGALLHLLAESGVSHLFGNPGTTELPLNDALLDEPRIRYILGVQEIPVMAMADGYAMASGKLGVVNLHISCGLGNAMGMLYNAFREGTPLLVTAGQQDRRLKFQEPILWGDMVSVARPWTKWAAEVERPEDLPLAVRRAVQVALAPPRGPVFLSIPLDVLGMLPIEAEMELAPPAAISHRVRPPLEEVTRAADLLRSAKNPAILAGSRIQEADAVAELVAVAERLGGPVFSEPSYAHGRLSFPVDHRLYAQTLPPWAPQIFERLKEFDVLLVTGMDFLREYVYQDARPAIPRHIKIVHCDESVYELGKNVPTAIAVLGDSKETLAELARLLHERMTSQECAWAATRADTWAAEHAAASAKLRAEIDSYRDARPLHASVMMESLARVLPQDVAVIEEAVTTTGTIFERLGALKNTSGYFAHRGWALGWGLGCSLGVKLAWPQRPVLGIIGEGAAMYGIQALWSAAHHKIGATIVIANNAQYRILKAGAAMLSLPAAREGRFLGMDLTDPEIDFVGLAQSLGVPAERVGEPDELSEKVAASLASGTPRLFDVPISRM